MANYLMPSSGTSPVTPTETLSRADIISVNDMYKLRIHNKAKSIEFTGFIPPDFSFSLSSAWSAPYADTTLLDKASGLPGKYGELANAANKGVKLGGGSTFSKLGSAKNWSGPSYLSIDLPIFIDAYSDTKTEVVANIVQLLSLCAPNEKGTMLIPPGPNPLKQVSQQANDSINTLTGSNMQSGIEDDESFYVEIGNFFTMSPCVVDSVTANFDNVWEDGTGNPISVDFVLSISSYFAVTREDLKKWLKVSQT